jgi:hypothetical protein
LTRAIFDGKWQFIAFVAIVWNLSGKTRQDIATKQKMAKKTDNPIVFIIYFHQCTPVLGPINE